MEFTDEFQREGIGISMQENQTREEMYQRNAPCRPTITCTGTRPSPMLSAKGPGTLGGRRASDENRTKVSGSLAGPLQPLEERATPGSYTCSRV